jgi:hypothetical protein
VATDIDARLCRGFERFASQRTDLIERPAIGVTANDGEGFTGTDAAKLNLLGSSPRRGERGAKVVARDPAVIDRDQIV